MFRRALAEQKDRPLMLTRLLAMTLAVAAGTCAADAGERQKISPTIVPNFNLGDLSANNNAYTLTPEEQKYDCKKLTGRTAIRIQQLRGTANDPNTSIVGRTMQRAATPMLGGTTRGIDPDGDRARDLSAIKAYNQQLTAKGCQPFDLDAEMKPGATGYPRPIPKGKPATATPAAAVAPVAAPPVAATTGKATAKPAASAAPKAAVSTPAVAAPSAPQPAAKAQ
jgi:hypothetical protein